MVSNHAVAQFHSGVCLLHQKHTAQRVCCTLVPSRENVILQGMDNMRQESGILAWGTLSSKTNISLSCGISSSSASLVTASPTMTRLPSTPAMDVCSVCCSKAAY